MKDCHFQFHISCPFMVCERTNRIFIDQYYFCYNEGHFHHFLFKNENTLGKPTTGYFSESYKVFEANESVILKFMNPFLNNKKLMK